MVSGWDVLGNCICCLRQTGRSFPAGDAMPPELLETLLQLRAEITADQQQLEQ